MNFDFKDPILNFSNWHHAPTHRFLPGQTYMTTAGTLHKRHFFRTAKQLKYLEKALLDTLAEANWSIHAWSVFSNHYHLVARDTGQTTSMNELICRLHSRTATWLNQSQNMSGRQVWFQYWDRCLTFESSYWARLNYVNNNPVKHGLVKQASDYPFCSARVYESQLSSRFLRRLSTYGYERVQIHDEFDPLWEGTSDCDSTGLTNKR